VEIWGIEAQGQCVYLICADEFAYIENGFAEHVGMHPEFFSVEPDGSVRVQTVKNEQQSLVGLQRFLIEIKLKSVPPLPLFHPGAFQLIAVVERVGDAIIIDQGAMNISGDSDVDPIFCR
jgi:hypothetical protein